MRMTIFACVFICLWGQGSGLYRRVRYVVLLLANVRGFHIQFLPQRTAISPPLRYGHSPHPCHTRTSRHLQY